jgi:hypothetical protein
MDQPIGVFDQLYEAEEGLRVKARMPRANRMVQDIEPLLKMGALKSFSIGFNVVDSEDSPDGTRIIKEIDLWEISLVTIPANPEAIVTSVKEVNKDAVEEKKGSEDKDDKIVDAIKAESINTKREFEQMLKDTGVFTKKAVIIFASRFKEFTAQGDLDADKTTQRDSDEQVKSLMEAMDKLKKSLT